MKVRLTKRVVEGSPIGSRDRFLWDTDIPGLGCKITPKGRRVYVLQYSTRGRTRRVTLGRHGADMTTEEARRRALRLRGHVADGDDPAQVRAVARAMPTVREFAGDVSKGYAEMRAERTGKDAADRSFLRDYAAIRKKLTSYQADRRNLQLYILPSIGHLRVDAVTGADVAHVQASMRDKPIQANRVLSLLGTMFNMAEALGLRAPGTNPTRHATRYAEKSRERFLSNAEIGYLGSALDAATRAGENASAIAAVRLLLLTGCRRDEIRMLRWDWVDVAASCLRLPDSKTGAKTVPLGAPAMQLLTDQKRLNDNPYVLPGKRRGRPFIAIQRAWVRLREGATVRLWADHYDEQVAGLVARLRARLGRDPTCAECLIAAKAARIELPVGLRDVHLHDLRHTHAAVGASSGESLLLIGKLLGHRQAATTARYAHLSDDPVRAAADRVSGRLAAALKGENADIRPFRPKR